MPNNPNAKDNLKPFLPGNNANPKGRPKGVENSSTRLLRLLKLKQIRKNPVTGKEERFTVLQEMDLAIVNKARKGDVRAYQEILDRFEGKIKQAMELSGPGGEHLNTAITILPPGAKDDFEIKEGE